MAYKIAILVGSLRKESINRKIALSMCAMRGDNLECELIEIGDLPLYNQDYDSAPEQPEQYVRFRDRIRAADGILFCTPEYNRSVPGCLKNAIDVGSRPYGHSVFDKKPAAVITASPGAIGGFGANHHLRQSCVFLNMPMMLQPEAYLGGVSDDSFGADGCLKDGPLKDVVTSLANAFHDWIELVVRSRQLMAEDAAHSERQQSREPEPADA